MPTKNRILLARGPTGSNLDQLFDVDIKANSQNLLKLKNNYDLSANVHIGNLEQANVQNLTVAEHTNLKTLKLSGNLTVDNSNVSLGTLGNPIKHLYVSNDSIYIGNNTSIIVNDDGELKVKKKDPITGVETEEDIGGGRVNENKQTFLELLTQQPYMFKKQGDPTSTTAKIDINWNFDDIIPKHKDTAIIAKLAHFTGKQSHLPFIDTIHFDISSSDTSNLWEEWTPKEKTIISDYNTGSFKTLQINKDDTGTTNITTTLSKDGSDNSFDIRVYGKNNSNDYPTIDNRALLFENLYFLTASAPSIPIFDDVYTNTASNQIKFKYKCVETENADPSTPNEQSDAVIDQYDVTYIEVASRAYNYTIVTSELTDNNNSISPGKNENQTFDITLNGLKHGIKYKYKVRAKNNLIGTYSDYSSYTTHSYFTRLPTSNSIVTTIDNEISSSSKTNIRGKTGTVTGSQIYINISTTSQGLNIIPNTTSIQEFEITNPSAQESTTTGYGNGVNGSSGLVTLEAVVDGTTKQTVSYGGFATTMTPGNTGSDLTFIDTISQTDIYSSVNDKNFRLKGLFLLNTITNGNVSSKIGSARALPHTLQYKYERQADVGGSNDITSHNIYVDDLTGIPGITYTTSTVEVTAVKYTMGIASVKTMEIIINRTYTNCNSAYGFIIGNGIVGKIGAVSNTSFSTENKTISAANIDITGSYIHSKTESSINYNTTFTNGRNDTLTETSTADNLVGTKNGTATNLTTTGTTYNSTTLKHFYDSASYSSHTATSSELNLITAGIYQIGNISNLGSDIAGITSTSYTNHSTAVNDSTLLYIGGEFQGNSNFTYPDTATLNYDGLSPTTYSHGTTSYDLSGNSSGDSGYKWIVFDIKRDGANYKLYNQTCTITTSGGISSIDIKTPLNSLFSATILNALFSKSAPTWIAVCFVKATKVSDNNIVMATPSSDASHSATAPWYNDGTGTPTWLNLSDSGSNYNKYKCGVGSDSISVDTTALNDDLQLFIGVKNV